MAFRGPREPSQQPADIPRAPAEGGACPARHLGNRHRIGGGPRSARSAARIYGSHHRSGARGTTPGQAASPRSARTNQVRWASADSGGAARHHARRVLDRARACPRSRERRPGHASRPPRGRHGLPPTGHAHHSVAGGGTGSCPALARRGWGPVRHSRRRRGDNRQAHARGRRARTRRPPGGPDSRERH